jgi:predicted methyltransferase
MLQLPQTDPDITGNIMHQATLFLTFLLILGACESGQQSAAPNSHEAAPQTAATAPANNVLKGILANQPKAVQARYGARNPQETLTFFGIEPGMTVIEALPGSGWYSKLLLPMLGEQGRLIGAGYDLEMLAMFDFYDDARLAELAQWADRWPAEAKTWGNAQSASVSAFNFGNMQQELHGTADAVLFIRALHNMARFSAAGDFLDSSIENAFQALKPGGIVGIVQHAARANMSATWASGARGYLHETFVIEQMLAAGFEFVGSSDINANPRDVPGVDDVVWRLPPVLSGSKDNAERVATMGEIGESNRMTLKFRKPHR